MVVLAGYLDGSASCLIGRRSFVQLLGNKIFIQTEFGQPRFHERPVHPCQGVAEVSCTNALWNQSIAKVTWRGRPHLPCMYLCSKFFENSRTLLEISQSSVSCKRWSQIVLTCSWYFPSIPFWTVSQFVSRFLFESHLLDCLSCKGCCVLWTAVKCCTRCTSFNAVCDAQLSMLRCSQTSWLGWPQSLRHWNWWRCLNFCILGTMEKSGYVVILICFLLRSCPCRSPSSLQLLVLFYDFTIVLFLSLFVLEASPPSGMPILLEQKSAPRVTIWRENACFWGCCSALLFSNIAALFSGFLSTYL